MLLRMRNIEKSFFESPVLKDLHFELHRGEVHALLGPNGAGKSTLIKILSGVFPPDSGQIFIDDQEVWVDSPSDAIDLGIFTLYQETQLIPTMSILENLFLGLPEMRNRIFINYPDLRKKAREVLDMFNCSLSIHTEVGTLSHSEKYIVAIARAFLKKAKIYILDEPTASISANEQKVLFDFIDNLRKQDVGIIYITHRISEVRNICDRVTVIKDGQNVRTALLKNLSDHDLFHMATGNPAPQEFHPNPAVFHGPPILEVTNLNNPPLYSGISFQLHKGEVLGFAGAMGSGKSAILKTIFGAIHQHSGNVFVRGENVSFAHPREAVMHGVGYLPDDRIDSSIIPNLSILDNSVVSSFPSNAEPVFLRRGWEIDSLLNIIFDLNLDLKNIDQSIQHLSGGTQQKVLFARWILAHCDILLLDEPTKGIDIATREDLHHTILEKASAGSAIIISSYDIAELTALCNRILVLNHGKIVVIMVSESATEQRIMDAIDL